MTFQANREITKPNTMPRKAFLWSFAHSWIFKNSMLSLVFSANFCPALTSRSYCSCLLYTSDAADD